MRGALFGMAQEASGGKRMTYEEAIKHFKSLQKRYTKEHNGRMCEKVNLALEALDKQIPKKPLHMHKNYYCPICKEDGWMLWDDAIPNDMDKYCGKCGQAIDCEVS